MNKVIDLLKLINLESEDTYIIIEDEHGEVVYPKDSEFLNENFIEHQTFSNKDIAYNNQTKKCYKYYVKNIVFENKEYKITVYEDVTCFKKEIKKLQRNLFIYQEQISQLKKDPVTNLYTRGTVESYFVQSLVASTLTDEPIYIIMCDIDLFKRINDKHGHIIGDRVLKRVANMIENSFSERGIVGRFGGDEFLIIAKANSKEEIIEEAELLRKKVQKIMFKTKDKFFNVTLSVGISCCEPIEIDENTDINIVIRKNIEKADMALYASKENGRNKLTIYKDDEQI